MLCGGTRLAFFLFQSSKQNHFPGNANQSVSPSFKDYFQSSVGVTILTVTMLTYHLLLQKKVEEFHKLGSCLFKSNFCFNLLFLCVIHCAVGSNFMQLHLYWFFWLNTCTIGWNKVWIIRTTFGHLHNQKIHKYTLRIQGFSMR